MTVWPQLAITALAEYILAARVVVVWENSKWAQWVVTSAWVGVIGSITILFALAVPGYAQAKVFAPGLGRHPCIVPSPNYTIFNKMWFLFLGYNALLGLMVLIKGITTYRREVLRGSHSQLREIVIRGSLRYYLIIIALDAAVLCIFKYGGTDLGLSATSFVLYITVITTCHLILHIHRAFYQPVLVGESRIEPPEHPEQIDMHSVAIAA